MKKTTLTLIICSIIGGILIITGVIIGIFQGFKGFKDAFSSFSGKTVKANQTYAATGEVNNLVIDADAGEITVKTADVEKITVQYASSGKIRVSLNETNGNLVIRQSVRTFLAKNMGGEITVTVPSSLAGLGADISLDAGVVEIKNIELNKAEIEVDAGQISVDNGTIARLSVEMSAGNVSLQDIKTEQAEIEIDVGNLEFNVIGNAAEYTLKKEIDLGDANFSAQTGSDDKKRIKITIDVGNANLNFTIAQSGD